MTQEIRKPDRGHLSAIQLLLHRPLIAAQRFVAARRRQPAGLQVQQHMDFPWLERGAAYLSIQEFFHQPVEAIGHQFDIRRLFHTDDIGRSRMKLQ